MGDHDRALARAFDGQAERFERAPVQSDPQALARLVTFAHLSPDSLILDAGCGPGLVSEAFLEAGHRVIGVDLSAEMIARAARRNTRFGERAQFQQGSLYDPLPAGPFDAAVSRYVLHHVTHPLAFVRRQVDLLRPGGRLILCDHATDPDPAHAALHEELERLRDVTHTRNLTPGGLVDLLGSAGLVAVRLEEEPFTLDFDEWFDRGTPSLGKDEARHRVLQATEVRGFRAHGLPAGAVELHGIRALVRGDKSR